MKESEKDTERYLNRKVFSMGGLSCKLVPSQHAGLPDRIVVLPGGSVMFVEVKSEGVKPRPLQEVVINRLRELGATVHVVDSKKQVDDILTP